MGLIAVAIIFLTMNTWTTNDNGAYAIRGAGFTFFNVNSKKPFVIGGILLGTSHVLGTAAAYFGEKLAIGIPPVNGILVSALAVPVMEVLFRSAGVKDAVEVKSGAEHV